MQRPAGLEPWFLPPALLAIGTCGVAPMLIPLEVVRIEGRALHVGAVMAAMGAGLVTAPLWSRLAEARRAHRGSMVGGALAMAAALAGFAFAREWHEWVALAFLMGAGAAATFTLANVLILERCPRHEQDAAFGWLQTLLTLGTVLGLVLAGVVTHWHLGEGTGFVASAVLALAAAAALRLQVAATASAPAPGGSEAGAVSTAHLESTSLAAASPSTAAAARARSASGPAPTSGQRAGRDGGGLPFALLLVSWLASLLGVNAVSALYPLLMRQEFHVAPALSSYALAAATFLSLLLFLPAGRLAATRGGLVVLQGGLVIRFLGLASLAWLAVTPALALPWIAFVPYAAFALVWPLLSVGSTILVTRLGAGTGGAGPGLGSAAAALASLAGPVVGGHVADSFGYQAVWVLAAAGVAVGFVLTLPLLGVPAAAAPQSASLAEGGAAR
jgi:MFS family permease